MLRMEDIYVVRHKVLVDGVSRREVARQMGFSRNTVRKYIEKPEPESQKRKPRKRPVLEEVRDRMDDLLQEWSTRTTRKQRITASALHKALLREGKEVGLSTIRNYVREWKRKRAEVYIPLAHHKGDSAQIDFFEVTVEVEGVRRKAFMFLMRLMYSGRDFAWLYDRCNQVSFLDAHRRAFAHFGGVPARCVYDNLTLAVKQVLFPQRELTTRFRALMSHYLVEPCFARPGTGHDKGGVESRGKGIRLQHLVPIPTGGHLDDICNVIMARIDKQAAERKNGNGQTVLERFSEEVDSLRPLPKRPFDPRLVVVLTVDSQSLVRYEQALYSLPCHWHSLEVTAYVGPTDIRFVCRDEIVVRTRPLPKGKNIKYRDYLAELRKKPQAVRQIAPDLVQELGAPFKELWALLEASHGGKEAGRVFAKILGAMVDQGEAAVRAAIAGVLESGEENLLGLQPILQPPRKTNAVPKALAEYEIESAKATDFDVLLNEGSRL